MGVVTPNKYSSQRITDLKMTFYLPAAKKMQETINADHKALKIKRNEKAKKGNIYFLTEKGGRSVFLLARLITLTPTKTNIVSVKCGPTPRQTVSFLIWRSSINPACFSAKIIVVTCFDWLSNGLRVKPTAPTMPLALS